MDGFGGDDGNTGDALVESIGGFSIVVVDGEALWCCQWHEEDRTAIAVRMGQFSFKSEEIVIFENGSRVLPRLC